MKTLLKSLIVGFVLASLMGTQVLAMNSESLGNLAPLPPPALKIKFAKEFCYHIPYSIAQLENSDNNETMIAVAKVAENNIPISYLKKGLLDLRFFEVAANSSIVCFYYPEGDLSIN